MNEAKEEARGLLQEACGEEVSLDEVQVSQVADLSSTLAFKLAKKLKKSPKEVAESLARKIKPVGLVGSVEAVNGYVNFHLNFENFAKHVLNTILLSEEDYGKPLVESEGKIVLEHTSVNPSGPIHVGRLRNSIIGDSIKRILNFAGYEVETHYFVNDIGKQMAVIALGFKEGVKPDEEVLSKYSKFKDKPDFKIFFEYVAANKVFESDTGFQKRVQEMIQSAESGDKKALGAMTSAAENCLKGQKQVFDKVGIKFDVFDFESKFVVNKKALEVVSKLEKSRLWKTTEVGSGLDLSGYGIEKQAGLTVLKRLDGTTVYSARDLAYHLEKQNCGDRLINVLGEDHKLQTLELKTILQEFLGFKKPLDVVHYSFVSFEGSKLSTRRGEIASVDELLEEAVEKAELEVEKRGIAGKETAGMIGIGAVKYHIIKTAPSKPITFSWSEALSFDGETAPYIQYVHARSCRILEKSGEKVSGISAEKVDLNLDEIEKQLLKELSLFPDVVETSARDLKPNLIANYLYALASTYNKFYIQCPVIPAEKKVRERRLLIVHSVKEVVKTGLNLLGIEAPERM
ncbi:MAG: arginine--tRNA ligase [Candidatus Altiarchaeales archaeon]|nr:arginine--tRNA ligase [Candidatus Altiarchaeales archaeon]